MISDSVWVNDQIEVMYLAYAWHLTRRCLHRAEPDFGRSPFLFSIASLLKQVTIKSPLFLQPISIESRQLIGGWFQNDFPFQSKRSIAAGDLIRQKYLFSGCNRHVRQRS